MTLKFPDPDKPPPNDPAHIEIGYYGEVDEKKDNAIGELLQEYGAKFLTLLQNEKRRVFVYSISRKYLIHAVRKLKRTNFSVIEGAGYDAS